MSDYGDMCKGMTEFRRKSRARFGEPCPKCVELLPRADPTILLPGKRCKIHSVRDDRTWQGIANEQAQRCGELVEALQRYVAQVEDGKQRMAYDNAKRVLAKHDKTKEEGE